MITLYSSPTCINCKIIKMMLDKKNIEYNIITDVDVMSKNGIMSIPTLEVDSELFNINKAKEWINKQ